MIIVDHKKTTASGDTRAHGINIINMIWGYF